MDRLRRIWRNSEELSYEPVGEEPTDRDDEPRPASTETQFSYVEYSIFLLLGVSMLWAWNMMLAAGPYFEKRFQSNEWIARNFQASEISVSTVANLGIMLVLARLQANASYPKRIVTSLCMNTVIFALLAVSTVFRVSAGQYFGFLMVMVLGSSLATGLCQNGIFAFVSGFGQPQYTQGIMTGQAVAGVLPCIIEIVAVLSAQANDGLPEQPPSGEMPEPPSVKPTAALAYFLTATCIAILTLAAFAYLLRRQAKHTSKKSTDATDESPEGGEPEERKSIPLLYLFRKLPWLSAAVFLVFAVTMVFPVFTQQILSVRPPAEQPPLLQPASFIPLALLFWNAGDLIGRLITAIPAISLVMKPRLVFVLAVCRLVFVALYYLCNIHGQGAIVPSDFFYLVVVQFLFGLSNGYLGSTCMIGAGVWVLPEEREAAGGFMGLCLVGGLTVGSLLSFIVAGGSPP